MSIRIASRFSPFSHECGERFLFPETSVCIQVFPTRLLVCEEGKTPVCVDFSWKGVVREFTAKLDLERKELSLFGFSKEGYFSYRVVRKELELALVIDKTPDVMFAFIDSSASIPLEKNRQIPLCQLQLVKETKRTSRLSLGSHKAQEFTKMKHRLDPCELIPLWIRMGSLCPEIVSSEVEGPFALLADLREAIVNEKKCDVIHSALCFFRASFQGVFVPHLIDENYQGLIQGRASGSALPLLTVSANLLSSLFYRENEKEIEILPLLPPELHCGRWIDIPLANGGTLHFEWTKKALRQLLLTADLAQEVTLLLPKGISSCRITRKRGMVKNTQIDARTLPLTLEKGEKITIDRFS